MSAAVGGSLAEISAGSVGVGEKAGGGKRGRITGFSPSSRRRLMRLVNSINQDEAPVPFFVSLTYHNEWPDYEGRRGHLDALKKRMERRYGEFSAIWRLEFMPRKSGAREGEVAPHYHLLVFLAPEQIVPYCGGSPGRHRREALLTLRRGVASMWSQVVDPSDFDLYKAGTYVKGIRSWNGVNYYASKYVAKPEALAVSYEDSTGRHWGVWRRGLLPIYFEHTQITLPHFFQIRRVLRRYARLHIRNTKQPRRVSCFLSHRTARRLLTFYGYYRA